MKIIPFIIGTCLVLGIISTLMLLNNRKKNEFDVPINCKEPVIKKSPKENTSLVDIEMTQEEPIYEDVKSWAIGSMYTRHKSAASLIDESVDTIRENVKISEDMNREIKQVSDELDKILSED